MRGRPLDTEFAPSCRVYVDQAQGEDPVAILQQQFDEARQLLEGISEEQSLFRYEPGKWSIRQALNHVTDNERAFVFRALWFARGFQPPLPGFDEGIAAAGAAADEVSWQAHREEFRRVRQATISFYRNLPPAGWTRTGVAADKLFTVRALAFITAGHAAHHMRVIRERYL